MGVGLAGLLTAGSASVGVLSAPPAAAASGDPPPPLSLRYLGSSSTIAFPGQQGEVSLSLAVPPNLTPTEIRGTAQFPSFVTCGNVDVLQGDRLISRTPIDPAVNSPIALPLRGVRLDRNSADIVLRTYLRTAGSCDFDADNRFRIVNAVVAYGGREATPARVAGFLPPILRALTIYVPEDVKPAEGAAAVQLATAVVANYGSAAVDIRTASLPRNETRPAAAVGPLERQVVISTDAPAGLSLGPGAGWPVLRIGGNPEELATQVQFLTSELSSIAISSAAVAGAPFAAPQLAPAVNTLADLGVSDQLVTAAAGWPSISFGIDQARLGRPSEDVRVQLSGTYTPLGGQIAVTVGPRVIASVPADPSGRYNTWVDIPPDLLARFTEVTVTYNHPDVGEGCGTGTRASLSLSSTGEVRSEVADPPQPSGFASLPQALMPRTALAWTDGGVDDVRRAVALMTGLQRLSAVRLGVDVMPVADAMSTNGPVVIVAADGRDVPELPLPIEADGGTLSVLGADGQRSDVVLAPAARFGSLQVAREDGRTVLLATSTGTAADLDAVLAWLDADPDRWPSLGGDAVLQVAGQQPVVVVADEVAPDPSESSSGTSWVTVTVVAAGVVVATALATFLLRRRRRTSSGG
ncbi:hypothetical protein [Gordonia amicalis]|uniref:hypothetical protein n=1 Tax=Gordonia amicalis TaxID=89053 RepID=UPI000346340C|nr:hypothetical protein [Gordonia amicalis]MDV7175019.1 hypothetical protein [Gordonia amicalis]NKX77885.1 hypothetical protein [Gordonia amicalis]